MNRRCSIRGRPTSQPGVINEEPIGVPEGIEKPSPDLLCDGITEIQIAAHVLPEEYPPHDVATHGIRRFGILPHGADLQPKSGFINDKPCFMYYDGKIVFTLFGVDKYKPKENFITVDMGAIKFVTNGADVMSPGIVDAYKDIKEGDQVWIQDELHHKPLAIGIALKDGINMISEEKGKSVKIFHYIGDKIWKSFT